MTVIALNAVIIFLLYFPTLKNHQGLIFIDHLFILFFLIEAIAKISDLGLKKYFSDAWNRFDFIIIVLSLPSLLEGHFHFPDVSWVLVFRLLRLVRLVRFLSFVPHLSQIIDGLKRALKASVFVFILIFGLNFLLGIFTCHLFGEIAPEYFGNPLISCYSIFQMFTVEGWNEIPQVVSEQLDNDIYEGLTRFYFVLVVLIGGILGMSLANAVFVDEMTMDNNDNLERKIDDLQAEVQALRDYIVKNQPPKT